MRAVKLIPSSALLLVIATGLASGAASAAERVTLLEMFTNTG